MEVYHKSRTRTVDVLPPPHPAASRFPMFGAEALRALADDIAKHGQRFPIVVFGGQLLDGRNRAAACKLANVEPRIDVLEACESPTAFVVSANRHRRHLTPAQLDLLADDEVLLEQLRKEAKARQREGNVRGGQTGGRGRNRSSPDSDQSYPGSTDKPYKRQAVALLAEAFGASRSGVYELRKVLREAPHLRARIDSGEIKTLAEAKRIASVGRVPPAAASKRKSPRPGTRQFKRAERDQMIAGLLGQHLGATEIAKKLTCSVGCVHDTKRRLGLNEKELNPLRRLTDFAIEFCDTWEIAIATDVSAWASATPQHVAELTKHLKNLSRKTANLIRRLNKEATGDSP